MYPETLLVKSRFSDSQMVFSLNHASKSYIRVAYDSLAFLNTNQ